MNRRENLAFRRALREFELVHDVATRPVPFLKGHLATAFGPNWRAVVKLGRAEWRSRVIHLLVHAQDVCDSACGRPLESTRKLADRAGVSHTTIARIRSRIRKSPEMYEANRRLYLRHARSGRAGHPRSKAASFPL
jgi:hypothetical protein